ncbi:MAG: Glu-tRNA(Gln) amidotransferase subunit GatD [Thermoplasmata archaeon]|nr:MAG: Glu-tRNA(Gln) amidotransferase subunit GatD [Thermoplasmata archaeon]
MGGGGAGQRRRPGGGGRPVLPVDNGGGERHSLHQLLRPSRRPEQHPPDDLPRPVGGRGADVPAQHPHHRRAVRRQRRRRPPQGWRVHRDTLHGRLHWERHIRRLHHLHLVRHPERYPRHAQLGHIRVPGHRGGVHGRDPLRVTGGSRRRKPHNPSRHYRGTEQPGGREVRLDEEAAEGGYVGVAGQLLRGADAQVGDVLEVRRADDGGTDRGLLMPHHEFSDEDIIVLKLPNGYNVGVRVDEGSHVTVVERPDRRAPPVKEIPRTEGLPELAIIGTGGTIASYVDYRTGAVHPALTAEELAFSVPGLADMYNLRAEALLSVHSEDLKPRHWAQIAQAVKAHFEAGAQGVVIGHGTDTMGFTAAALAFMLPELPGPVVLVGSQRSSDRPSSDAVENLRDACAVATSDAGEVLVVMHGDHSDETGTIHRATRVRKLHTSARSAFRSVNSEPVGTVNGGEVRWDLPVRPKSGGSLVIDDRVEEAVAMVYAYPGIEADLLEAALADRRGLVIAGTGLGHITMRVLEVIREATAAGKVVAMTSQCLWGAVNMNVYSNGRDLLTAGVVPAGDTLPETAYVKLCCLLGRDHPVDEVRMLMGMDLAGELSERRPLGGGEG